MTSDAEPSTPASPPPASWPGLDARECRVLGVLVEKAKTTPDAYPLSLNALVTGSNQKSNRDPVLNLGDADVEQALAGLQKRSYVQKIVGGRVERWRHVLYEAWHVNKVELAILAELLLRSPQTEGELRARASRMEPIDDLEALRPVLQSLASRGLVTYLSPEGRRGTVLAHGFHAPADLQHLRSRPLPTPSEGGEPRETVTPSPNRLADLEGQITALRTEVEALRAGLTETQQQISALSEQLRGLKRELGS